MSVPMNKVLLAHGLAMLLHLCTIYSCYHNTMTESINCDRDHKPEKPKIFDLAIYRQGLLTSGLAKLEGSTGNR